MSGRFFPVGVRGFIRMQTVSAPRLREMLSLVRFGHRANSMPQTYKIG